MSRPLLAQLNYQSVFEKDHQIIDLAGDIDVAPSKGTFPMSAGNTTKADAESIVEYDSDYPQSGSTRRIRILAARRLLVDLPKADQHGGLVGQSHANADRIGGGHNIPAPRRVWGVRG